MMRKYPSWNIFLYYYIVCMKLCMCSAPTLPKYPPPSLDPEETNITVTPTSIEISIIPAQSFGAPITGYYVIVVDDTPKVGIYDAILMMTC